MIQRLLALVAAGFLLGGCSAEGIGGVTLVTHGAHRLAADERVPGAVAVAGGSLVIAEGAAVGGDVFVGDGVLLVAGSVEGDISALGGTVVVEATGRVAGAVRTGAAASVEVRTGATIDGGILEGAIFPEAPVAPRSPLLDLAWAVARSLAVVLLAAVLRGLAPQRVGVAAEYLGRLPVPSLAYGFLVALVGIALIVFMAFTVILIPVALVGLAALTLALALGVAGALEALARRLGAWRSILLLSIAVAVVPALPLLGGPLVVAGALTFVGAATLAYQRPAISSSVSRRAATGR